MSVFTNALISGRKASGTNYLGPVTDLPSADTVNPGVEAVITDLNYAKFISDGSYWRPAGRQTVVQWNDGWPSPSSVNFSGEYTGANRLAFGTQWYLHPKLWAPGTNLTCQLRARKNGTTSTGSVSLQMRPTQFTSATDTAGSWGSGSGTWSAAQIWLAGKNYVYCSENSLLVNHAGWFGDTATSPSAAVLEVSGMNLPATGLWLTPACALTGGSDSADLISVTMEMY